MKYARILENIAIETFEPPEGVPIADCFHPDLVVQFVQVPDEVVQNSTLNADGSWSLPPVIAEPSEPATPEGPAQDEPDVIG